MNKKEKFYKFLIYGACILVLLAISFFGVAGLYYAICVSFDLVFSWKKVIWFWLAIFLLNCSIRGIRTE